MQKKKENLQRFIPGIAWNFRKSRFHQVQNLAILHFLKVFFSKARVQVRRTVHFTLLFVSDVVGTLKCNSKQSVDRDKLHSRNLSNESYDIS